MPQQAKAPEPPPPPGFDEVVFDEVKTKEASQQSYNYPSAMQLPMNVGLGLAKGLGQTIQGGGNMLRRYAPWLDVVPPVQYDLSYIQPHNWQQSLGSGIEHTAEYMAGGASVPFRMLPQGLMAAGLAGAHTGGDPEAMLGTGIIGAATAGLGGMASRGASRLRASVTNSAPVQALMRYIGAAAPTAPPAAAGAAGAGAGPLLRGLPAGTSESLATIPKYEWSGGEPSYTWHAPEQAPVAPAPVPPPRVGDATIQGQKALPASPIVRPDGTIDATGHGEVFGQEGGLGPQKNVDITPVKPPPVRTEKGPFRKGTAEDVAVKKGNIGRTVTEPVTTTTKTAPKKPPVKSPEPPTKKPPTASKRK